MATIPSDPLFSTQWHLQNNTTNGLDLNIVDVWDDYTGAGVDVAVIDDAMQRNHPDLDGNYSVSKDWDFEDNDTDASPSRNGFDSDGDPYDAHGTSVLGIIGAEEGNGIGGVGVAYDSTIFGFKTGFQFGAIDDAINNASGLLQTAGTNREADIVNMSFGWVNFNRNSTLRSVLSSVNDAAEFGRNNLGTIMVKSAGNSRLSDRNEDTNASLLSASPHTITVAGVNQDGFINRRSTHGASVLVSAFYTSPRTTDRTGSEGYSSGDYTGFSGTSASAPMVSGVIALMLEANPDLGWRDVQEILAYSARHVGSDVGTGISGNEEYAWAFNGADNWNGGGLHFSNDYGFGLVDAKAAVRLAETWENSPQTSANDVSVFRDLLNSSTTISTSGTSFNQYVSSDVDIEHVEVDINFTEWYDRGDLELRLISPDGTSSILLDNTGENNGAESGGFGSGRWEFFSNAFRGENSTGTWTVELFDQDSTTISPITINDIDITFRGQAVSDDDTFIFTEEFSDYAGSYGHSTAFNGGSGSDTINAAAIDSSSTIDLNTGTGSIDGVAITTSGIETVIGGDGHDVITGNSLDNRLFGMRGNDRISGRSGDDYMDGGPGWDTVDYTYWNGGGTYNLATEVASFVGFYDEDILNFEGIVTGDGDDVVTGTSGYNRIETGGGDDVLNGGSGGDYLVGTTGVLGGAGEIDVFNPGDYGARDDIILGNWLSSYYDGAGIDYAVIDNFDRDSYAGETDSDKLIVHGGWADYTLTSYTGTVAGISITNGTRISQGSEDIAYVDSGGLLTASDFVSAVPVFG